MSIRRRLERLEQKRPHVHQLTPEHAAAVRKIAFDEMRREFGDHLTEQELWECQLRKDPKARARAEGRKWW